MLVLLFSGGLETNLERLSHQTVHQCLQSGFAGSPCCLQVEFQALTWFSCGLRLVAFFPRFFPFEDIFEFTAEKTMTSMLKAFHYFIDFSMVRNIRYRQPKFRNA